MNFIRNSLRYVVQIACGEKIPVWLAILLVLLGAVGTYYIAPKLNERFQLQIAKREFMVDSMSEFANSTKIFIEGIGKLINQNQSNEELKISLVSKAAELNFFAVQLAYVIPEQKDLLLEFQKSVEQVQRAVAIRTAEESDQEIIRQLKVVSTQSLYIYEALAKKAGLNN